MADLETQEMLARFAGYETRRRVAPFGEWVEIRCDESGPFSPRPAKPDSSFVWVESPLYGSDLSAACSLLPKIAAAIARGHESRCFGGRTWGDLWGALGWALAAQETEKVCLLIADAVRELEKANGGEV